MSGSYIDQMGTMLDRSSDGARPVPAVGIPIQPPGAQTLSTLDFLVCGPWPWMKDQVGQMSHKPRRINSQARLQWAQDGAWLVGEGVVRAHVGELARRHPVMAVALCLQAGYAQGAMFSHLAAV